MDQAILIDSKAHKTLCPDDVLPSPITPASQPLPKRASVSSSSLVPLLAGGVLPPTAGVVLRKSGRSEDMIIESSELYGRLQALARLNPDATSTRALFP